MFKSGEWWIYCDRCGTVILASESRHEHDGKIVCRACYEPRHPQDVIRIRKDRIIPPFIRPDNDGHEFDGNCDRTSRANYAVANCAVANTI